MDVQARFDRCIVATRDVMGDTAARDLCMNAVVGSRRRVGQKTRRQNRSDPSFRRVGSARRSSSNKNRPTKTRRRKTD